MPLKKDDRVFKIIHMPLPYAGKTALTAVILDSLENSHFNIINAVDAMRDHKIEKGGSAKDKLLAPMRDFTRKLLFEDDDKKRNDSKHNATCQKSRSKRKKKKKNNKKR